MILGYHLTLAFYGFWLPNDPRGSRSTRVWASNRKPHGQAHHTDTRTSIAHHPHDHAKRRAGRADLRLPPVRISGIQARAVGRGFARAVRDGDMTVHAAAIMPDHAHLVIARHEHHTIERMRSQLKQAATRQIREEGIHPFQHHVQHADERIPSMWATGGWIVYLDTPEAVMQRMRYVETNPIQSRLPRQRWPFVSPYPHPHV